MTNTKNTEQLQAPIISSIHLIRCSFEDMASIVNLRDVKKSPALPWKIIPGATALSGPSRQI